VNPRPRCASGIRGEPLTLPWSRARQGRKELGEEWWRHPIEFADGKRPRVRSADRGADCLNEPPTLIESDMFSVKIDVCLCQ
jgi:hypothetical protein